MKSGKLNLLYIKQDKRHRFELINEKINVYKCIIITRMSTDNLNVNKIILE